MKKYMLALAGLVFLIGNPISAETMKIEGMSKTDAMMCDKHCNIMDLEKQVNALKTQAASADKAATKEHLKKDIETYEKKLQQLKKELDSK